MQRLVDVLAAAFPEQDVAGLVADVDRFVGAMRDRGLLVTDGESAVEEG